MLSEYAEDMIKTFEGLRLKAYLDIKGVPTIGYGHTRGVTKEDVKTGRVITEPDAERLLEQDLAVAEGAVIRHVTVGLRQFEHEALTSLVFNIGAAAFATSTLIRKLNEGDRLGAACEFTRWNKITTKGEKDAHDGQTARRTRELAHFLGAR